MTCNIIIDSDPDPLQYSEGQIILEPINRTLEDHENATPVSAIDDVHGLVKNGCVIVLTGSNSNGSFTVFANGLQICTQVLEKQYINIDNSNNGLYRSTLQSWVYPRDFQAIPSVSVGQGFPGNWGTWISGGAYSRFSARWRVFRMRSGSNISVGNITLTAIGVGIDV